MEMYRKLLKYMAAHPEYNSAVHLVIGIGIGILVTYPLIGAHPVRWGALFLVLGLAGHFYPFFTNFKR
jgi:hypothetical protein